MTQALARLTGSPLAPALWPIVFRRTETRLDLPTGLGKDGTGGLWLRVVVSGLETYGEPTPRKLAPVLTDDRHRPCPQCGAQLTLQARGRAHYWHHAPTASPCDYKGWTLGPRVFVPQGSQAPQPGPRSKTDGRYAWALRNQRDYEGYDNRADYARAQFKRREQRHNAGVLQGSLGNLTRKD